MKISVGAECPFSVKGSVKIDPAVQCLAIELCWPVVDHIGEGTWANETLNGIHHVLVGDIVSS